MKPTRLGSRKRIPCRQCGRGVLVAAYAGSYPTVVRCVACRQNIQPSPQVQDWRQAA